jgi:hypothetical protein
MKRLCRDALCEYQVYRMAQFESEYTGLNVS